MGLLRRKKPGLLGKEGGVIEAAMRAQLRGIFDKGRKQREGLLAPQKEILKGIDIESAKNPTPLILTPGSTGV